MLAHFISFNMCALLICLPVVVVVFSQRLRSTTSKRTYLSFLYWCSRYYQLVVWTKQTWSSKKQEKKVDFTKSPKFADSWGLLHQFINWEKFTNERKKWSSIAMVFFSSPHFVIGLVNSCHTLEQPEAKQKKYRLVYKWFPAFEVARAVTDAL